MKRTFERLGIPEQNENSSLASKRSSTAEEAVYSNIKKAVGEPGMVPLGARKA